MPEQELRAHIRRAADCQQGDWLLSKKHGRASSIVISQQLANLLREFARPTTIKDAVASYCAARGLDAEIVTADAHNALLRMRSLGYLCSSQSGHRLSNQSNPTQPPEGGWSDPQLIQNLNGTQVFRVDWQGQPAALKVGQPDSANRSSTSIILEEARILSRLPDGPFPKLLEAGAICGRDYLLCSWFEGADVLSLANRMRSSDLGGLLILCARILDAYRMLEAAGWLHGDIHPRNIIVPNDGVPRLIDFGQARRADRPRRGMRSGITYFFEPQYADALLNGREASAYDAASEQYALAALLQLLITGHHYQDFKLERRSMLAQIVDGEPSPFSSHLGPSFPSLEAVLGRSFSKAPEARHPTVAAFAVSFRRSLPVQRLKISMSKGARTGFAPGGVATLAWERTGLPVANLNNATVHDGAAGFAFAQYRLALLTGDAALLASSEVWIVRAVDLAKRLADRDPLGNGEPFPGSLHHGVAGIHCVAALIAAAQGNGKAVAVSVGAFVKAIPNRADVRDITHGLAGALVGCSILAERLVGTVPDETLDLLRRKGDQIASSIWPASDDQSLRPPLADGIAHGESGRLYAYLRWMKASRSDPSYAAAARLLWLFPASRSEHLATKDAGSAASYIRASWCNGAAGHVQLLHLAADLTGMETLTHRAVQAAEIAWRDKDNSACLCCGRTGRAFAMLSIARATGETIWIQRATTLIDAAEAAVPSLGPGLYKGRAGVELARAELATPQCARMPLFE